MYNFFKPCNDKWSVLLSFGHQDNIKFHNQWTGHTQMRHYRIESKCHPKYLECNKGMCQIYRAKYSPEDVILWILCGIKEEKEHQCL